MGFAALRTENLTKRFGRLLAVDGLDLSVPAGEVFGFLGPNGAGKSTTIRMVLGLVRPTAGRRAGFVAAGVATVAATTADGRPPAAVVAAVALILTLVAAGVGDRHCRTRRRYRLWADLGGTPVLLYEATDGTEFGKLCRALARASARPPGSSAVRPSRDRGRSVRDAAEHHTTPPDPRTMRDRTVADN